MLPYRNPFITARAIATLDVFCGGRVTVGVGAGYLKGEHCEKIGRKQLPGIMVAGLSANEGTWNSQRENTLRANIAELQATLLRQFQICTFRLAELASASSAFFGRRSLVGRDRPRRAAMHHLVMASYQTAMWPVRMSDEPSMPQNTLRMPKRRVDARLTAVSSG